MSRWLWLAAALAAPSAAAAADLTAAQAAQAFGARNGVVHASLSPDGKSVAVIQPLKGAASGVFVAKLNGQDGFKPLLQSTGNPENLRSCSWASDSRIVCNVTAYYSLDADQVGFTRQFAIDAASGEFKLLSARPGRAIDYAQYGGDVLDWLADDAQGAVLMTREFLEEDKTGTLIGNTREGLAVERVDTATLRRSLIEPPKKDVVDYISDQHGGVRIYAARMVAGNGYLRSRLQYFYRQKAGGPWALLSTIDTDEETGFRPVAVDKDLNAAYGFERIDGRQAVVRIALDGSMKREVILARPDVDVDELIQIGRQRRVVGVGFATDRRQAVYFDPALKSLVTALSRALPGQPQVRIVDASAGEKELLVWAGSDVDPGSFYLYEKATRQLSPVVADRPQLAKVKLAPMKAITFKAADGTQIPAYLTLPPDSDGKNIPALVMPHGGPGARDEWGFDWLAQFFAARGYAVLQPNFRGSAGYGQAWFQENGFKSWRTAIGDVNDAGRWLAAEGIAAPGKLGIIGWSYGGYAALQSHVLDPDLFKATVAIAPVTDLDVLREQYRNFTNFRLVQTFIGDGPHVSEGSPARNAAKIKAPVLIFHGDKDTNVELRHARLMEDRLKSAGGKVELVVYTGLDHQLADSAARAQMLERSDAFLRQALGL